MIFQRVNLMKQLKELIIEKSWEKMVYDKIYDFFNDTIFNYLVDSTNEPLWNEKDVLLDGFKKGQIFYSNGLVYGKFNNAISSKLVSIGARRIKKGYEIKLSDMPLNLQVGISNQVNRSQTMMSEALKYLAEVEGNLDFIYQKLDFIDDMRTISNGLHNQLVRTLKPLHIIPYELSPDEQREIESKYTNNFDYYIKKWTEHEISKLRTGLQELIMKGATPRVLQKYIEKEKGAGFRKANRS